MFRCSNAGWLELANSSAPFIVEDGNGTPLESQPTNTVFLGFALTVRNFKFQNVIAVTGGNRIELSDRTTNCIDPQSSHAARFD